MVHGAQWLSFWHEAIGVPQFGLFEQSAEQFGVQIRHVTGHDQVPVGSGVFQSGANSFKGTASGFPVRNYRETEVPIFFRRTHNGYRTYGLLHCSGKMNDKREAVPIEQSLVAAHARTGASCKHISRAAHAEIIASGIPVSPTQSVLWKEVYNQCE